MKNKQVFTMLLGYCKLYFRLENKITQIETNRKMDNQNTKNNLSVFKRRTAINITTKPIKDQNYPTKNKKFKKITNRQDNQGNQNNIEFLARFEENIHQKSNNYADKPTNLLKKKKQFEAILKNIQMRGGSFYKYGFKSYQSTNKKLLSEILNIPLRKMRGTMNVGELWSNFQTQKYFKENKIFTNKLKLMDRLKQAKTEQDRQLMTSTPSLTTIGGSKNSILSSRYAFSRRSTLNRLSANQLSNTTFRELNNSMEELNKRLKHIQPSMSTQKNIDRLRCMQECVQKMSQIDSHYHEQIGQWI